MSKYLEFKEVPFKGKTKRFEVVSKTALSFCKNCNGYGFISQSVIFEDDTNIECDICDETGRVPDVLGKIQWYFQWRQYTFSPSYPTVWNKDCLKTIQDFLQKLMDERKK